MTEKLRKYLFDVIGEDVVFSEAGNIEGSLTLALSNRYRIYLAEIYGKRVCFAIDKDSTTPAGYEREISVIRKIADAPVVLVVEELPPVDVHRLIIRRMDFIVPGKRMFMPSLMIDLGGRYATKEVSDSIPPLSQLIVLFHLQRESLNGFDAKAVAEKFSVTYLTASRALKWIGEKIAPLNSDGRKCLLAFPDDKELLHKVKPLLRTPVVKRIFTDDDISDVDGVIAGESALEVYSMLAASGRCLAVGKDTRLQIYEDRRGTDNVEIWMYNPRILAKDGVCDKISLILSLADNADERVHKHAENLKREIGW